MTLDLGLRKGKKLVEWEFLDNPSSAFTVEVCQADDPVQRYKDLVLEEYGGVLTDTLRAHFEKLDDFIKEGFHLDLYNEEVKGTVIVYCKGRLETEVADDSNIKPSKTESEASKASPTKKKKRKSVKKRASDYEDYDL